MVFYFDWGCTESISCSLFSCILLTINNTETDELPNFAEPTEKGLTHLQLIA